MEPSVIEIRGNEDSYGGAPAVIADPIDESDTYGSPAAPVIDSGAAAGATADVSADDTYGSPETPVIGGDSGAAAGASDEYSGPAAKRLKRLPQNSVISAPQKPSYTKNPFL